MDNHHRNNCLPRWLQISMCCLTFFMLAGGILIAVETRLLRIRQSVLVERVDQLPPILLLDRVSVIEGRLNSLDNLEQKMDKILEILLASQEP